MAHKTTIMMPAMVPFILTLKLFNRGHVAHPKRLFMISLLSYSGSSTKKNAERFFDELS